MYRKSTRGDGRRRDTPASVYGWKRSESAEVYLSSGRREDTSRGNADEIGKSKKKKKWNEGAKLKCRSASVTYIRPSRYFSPEFSRVRSKKTIYIYTKSHDPLSRWASWNGSKEPVFAPTKSIYLYIRTHTVIPSIRNFRKQWKGAQKSSRPSSDAAEPYRSESRVTEREGKKNLVPKYVSFVFRCPFLNGLYNTLYIQVLLYIHSTYCTQRFLMTPR